MINKVGSLSLIYAICILCLFCQCKIGGDEVVAPPQTLELVSVTSNSVTVKWNYIGPQYFYRIYVAKTFSDTVGSKSIDTQSRYNRIDTTVIDTICTINKLISASDYALVMVPGSNDIGVITQPYKISFTTRN